jgi:CPA2 family monovalent cation:H+ antiporter-2
VIGPFTPGLTIDEHSVRLVADIGVAFLLFALGTEFSAAELRRMGRSAGLGGGIQVLVTMLLGVPLAPLLGATHLQGLYLGALLALSSTVVTLKVLMTHAQLQSLPGKVALGITVTQDIAMLPLMIVLPSAIGGSGVDLPNLAITVIKASAVLLGSYLIAARVAPWVLAQVAIPATRELFLLGVVSLALGTALLTQLIGLSLAFGAFVAGLVLAESRYRTQAVAEALPIRDLFTSLFFVSVGMLINPGQLLAHAAQVGLLSAVVVPGKFLIVALILIGLGLPGRVAIIAGLSLAQIGEFSFVLARVGVDSHAIPSSLFDLTLGTALVSLVAAPFLLRLAPSLEAAGRRIPFLRTRFEHQPRGQIESDGLHGHSVICGYGRVGSHLAHALARRGASFLVIEYNPEIIGRLEERGVPVVYGDASNPTVLEQAHLRDAVLLAVLLPEPAAAELTVRRAREHSPDLDIIARANSREQVNRLRAAGATEVVQPEFEAGLEVIRHALQRYGITGAELARDAADHRADFYQGTGDER